MVDVHTTDSNTFTCVAKNALGDSEKNFVLKVYRMYQSLYQSLDKVYINVFIKFYTNVYISVYIKVYINVDVNVDINVYICLTQSLY